MLLVSRLKLFPKPFITSPSYIRNPNQQLPLPPPSSPKISIYLINTTNKLLRKNPQCPSHSYTLLYLVKGNENKNKPMHQTASQWIEHLPHNGLTVSEAIFVAHGLAFIQCKILPTSLHLK